MPGPTRQDTYAVSVWVDGIELGIFDKMSGGEVDSDTNTYRPGNLGDPVDLGGYKTVGNVVVSRLYRLGREDDQFLRRRIAQAGNASMKVSKQPLTIEGVKEGKPLVYVGTLKRVSFPEHDSESTTAGLLELEMTVKGFPTV